MTENHYANHASEAIGTTDMEAVVANTEQGWDTDQAIVHNMYIGWVMGIAKTHGVELTHRGGNQCGLTVVIDKVDPSKDIDITLVIPYPPEGWSP